MGDEKIQVTKRGDKYYIIRGDSLEVTDAAGAAKYLPKTPTILTDTSESRNRAPTIEATDWTNDVNAFGRTKVSPLLRGIFQEIGAMGGRATGAYGAVRTGMPSAVIPAGVTGGVAGSAAGSAVYDKLLDALESKFLGLSERKGGNAQEKKDVYDYLGEGFADRALDKAVRVPFQMAPTVIKSVVNKELEPIKTAIAKNLPWLAPKKSATDILAEQEARGYTNPVQPTIGQMTGGFNKWAENFLGTTESLEARAATQGAAIKDNVGQILTKTNKGIPTEVSTGNQELANTLVDDVKRRAVQVSKSENRLHRAFDALAARTKTTVDIPQPTNVSGTVSGTSGGSVQIPNAPIPGTPATPRNPTLPYYAQSGTPATAPIPQSPTTVNVAPWAGGGAAGAQSIPPAVIQREVVAPVYVSGTTQMSQGVLDRINSMITEQRALGVQGSPLKLRNLEHLRDAAEQMLSAPKETGTGRMVLPYSIVKPLKNAGFDDPALQKFGQSLYADARRSMQDWVDAGAVEKAYGRAASATKGRIATEDITKAGFDVRTNPEDILRDGLRSGTDAQRFVRAGGDKRVGATAFLRDAFQGSQNTDGVWQPKGIREYLERNMDVYKQLTNGDQRSQIEYLLKKMELVNTSAKSTGSSLVMRGMNAAMVLGSQALGASFGPYPLLTSAGAMGVVPMAELFTKGIILDPKVSRNLVALSQTQPGTQAASRLTQTLMGSLQGVRMIVTLPDGREVPSVVGPDGKLTPEKESQKAPAPTGKMFDPEVPVGQNR